jgi:hypothetical protein
MAIVTIHPQDIKEEEIRSEMERMKDYLLASPVGNQLVSIYYQVSQHTRATPNSALSSSYTASRTFTSKIPHFAGIFFPNQHPSSSSSL